jgi:hypothetical protein
MLKISIKQKTNKHTEDTINFPSLLPVHSVCSKRREIFHMSNFDIGCLIVRPPALTMVGYYKVTNKNIMKRV